MPLDRISFFAVTSQLLEESGGEPHQGYQKIGIGAKQLPADRPYRPFDRDMKGLRQEVEIMRRLDHDNIIQLFEALETDKSFCVITEFAKGDLFRLLQDRRRFREDEVGEVGGRLTVNVRVSRLPDVGGASENYFLKSVPPSTSA